MKRLATSILALGLAAAVGAASAQSSGYTSRYGQPTVDRYGQSSGGYYDYARVIRVDPVIQSGYGYGNTGAYSNGAYSSGSQRCYTRNDGYVSNDAYNRNGYGNDGYYDRDGNYRGDGGYRDNNYYGNEGYRGGNETSRTVATVVGGVIGAVVGSKVGGGSGRYVASALGTMAGGLAGRSIYDQSVRQRRTASVTVCDPEPVRDGYGYNRVNDQRVAGYDVSYEYGGRTHRTRTDYHPGDRIRVRVDVRPE